MDGKKKKGKRKRSGRYAVILPHFIVLLLFLLAFGERLLVAEALFGDMRRSEASLSEVQAEYDRLKEELAAVDDPASLQERMRRLGYIYPGETVYLQVTD